MCSVYIQNILAHIGVILCWFVFTISEVGVTFPVISYNKHYDSDLRFLLDAVNKFIVLRATSFACNMNNVMNKCTKGSTCM